MVVVLIISMLMAIAVPSYQRVRKRAQAAALVNDLRVYAAVFQAYSHENGVWPADTPAGVVPTGLTSQELKTDVWTHASPVGGKFKWDYNAVSSPGIPRAAIGLADTSDAPLIMDPDLFAMMDEALDDGNLATGSFIFPGPDGYPIYILEP